MKIDKLIILCLTLLAAGALFFIYKQYNPAEAGSLFPSCPSYSLFNIYCPGCGSQRATHYLLQGDIRTAWSYNPALIVLLPLILVLIIQFFLRNFFDVNWRIRLFESNTFLFILLALFVAYMIARNIPLSALDFLRPPAKQSS